MALGKALPAAAASCSNFAISLGMPVQTLWDHNQSPEFVPNSHAMMQMLCPKSQMLCPKLYISVV